jgi:hypothetical protein
LVFCLFRLFRKTETPILKRNNRHKRLVSDSAETSFGFSFGCFDTKLVWEDTLVIATQWFHAWGGGLGKLGVKRIETPLPVSYLARYLHNAAPPGDIVRQLKTWLDRDSHCRSSQTPAHKRPPTHCVKHINTETRLFQIYKV